MKLKFSKKAKTKFSVLEEKHKNSIKITLEYFKKNPFHNGLKVQSDGKTYTVVRPTDDEFMLVIKTIPSTPKMHYQLADIRRKRVFYKYE